ncbi:beta carboxy-cis-cis-muconate lactonizing enzyme, cyloisomerase, CLME2 [Rhizodiscina lignyota]|uniref:Beta carboxy-cis-cis-muconate lactonizing enzyme, cyloisomerase, CLME2 n=1 Tax=Rhizodiscina lignyota TaxID=1504668 RepID=A0A9P4I8W0_9PEZI|nr:beta carboxy-cis-cis-muconate lactonizing enzyme, cyloisomerase, CLME2 [Rhizodiscina lignyota]
MTTVIDSYVFHNTFSTPEIAAIWSDKSRTGYYLKFEAALAKVQAKLNIIPQNAADEIVKHCKLEHIDFEELRRKTEKIGYPILPMVQQLVAKVNIVEDKLGEWAHWGTTTQDLTDTAAVLQVRDTIQLVEQALDDITNALVKLCEKYKTTPMAARSNLQQAVPMSFGFKMARLLATFQRHKQRLAEMKPRLLVLEFSGAAGTLATLSEASSYGPPPKSETNEPVGLWCQRLLAEELELAVPSIAWHTERDNFAEFSCYLAILTSTCAKFGTDLKLMMQSEVGEASEPYVAHRGSSSTMPQKRNPVGCAYIHAMASSVRTMTGGMIEAVNADHERSTGPWQIEWIMLPQICALSHACLKQTAYLMDGIEVDEEGMQRNLDMSRGAIVSEAVMMGLGKSLGRQYAHDIVYDLCRQAQLENKSLLELLLANEEIKKAGLKDDELKALCDPGNYLGLSEAMVNLVLKEVQEAK